MMSYTTTKNAAYKMHAEVFTPPGGVFEMVLNLPNLLINVDATIFDPAVGAGQFPCAELVLKLFYNIERLDEELALRALKSLYGMNIQAESAAKARQHLIKTLCDSFLFFTGKDFTRLAEARAIVEENIMQGDSLKYMRELTNPQQSLF